MFGHFPIKAKPQPLKYDSDVEKNGLYVSMKVYKYACIQVCRYANMQ